MSAVGYVGEHGEYPKSRPILPPSCGRCDEPFGWRQRGDCLVCGWRLHATCPFCEGQIQRFPSRDGVHPDERALVGHMAVCRGRPAEVVVDNLLRYSWRAGYNPNLIHEPLVLLDPPAEYIQLDELDALAVRLGWPHERRWDSVRFVASRMPGHE